MLWGISDWVAGLPRTRLDYVYPKKNIPETFFDESTGALSPHFRMDQAAKVFSHWKDLLI